MHENRTRPFPENPESSSQSTDSGKLIGKLRLL
jgi:hypothetical protein